MVSKFILKLHNIFFTSTAVLQFREFSREITRKGNVSFRKLARCSKILNTGTGE